MQAPYTSAASAIRSTILTLTIRDVKNNDGQDVVIERMAKEEDVKLGQAYLVYVGGGYVYVKIIEIDPASEGCPTTFLGMFANGNTYPFFIEELNDITLHGINRNAEIIKQHYENEKENS
jgi:hypothetical protein